MDAWIELARGPLFHIALTIMALGLAYRLVATTVQIITAWRRAGDRRLPLADIATATLAWLLPLRSFTARPVYSSASIVFHIGMLALPLFLVGHLGLLPAALVPGWWPSLPPTAADVLTVAAVVSLSLLILSRFAFKSSRTLSRAGDVSLLVLLAAMMGFGFLAAHPGMSPLSARSMLLLHILSANLVLALMPVTKIAHCVLYPLLQLVFQLGWHFPAESGRHVAHALAKENEPV